MISFVKACQHLFRPFRCVATVAVKRACRGRPAVRTAGLELKHGERTHVHAKKQPDALWWLHLGPSMTRVPRHVVAANFMLILSVQWTGQLWRMSCAVDWPPHPWKLVYVRLPMDATVSLNPGRAPMLTSVRRLHAVLGS